ncbi:CHAT domain-containing protein [Kitasatospora sp. NBC_01266]|uniref:CHAT domain-containing protein n=1 Tax=Kitasatospora sp. NBC_01266 TaxID=2903572 RepID=UPI002E324D40|nr:CHAT domain-containing protein [Kitasatospora sp. NBC_01266]
MRAAMAAPDREIPFFGDSPESVLSLETLGNVAEIVYDARDRLAPGTAGGEEADLEAIYLAACFHWARCQHLPAAESRPDHDASVFLFSVVHAVRPDAVPQPRRSHFAALTPPLQPPGEVMHAVAVVLFLQSVQARDRDRLAQAAMMIQQAREMLPTHQLDPAITFNLGSAYAELFALGGNSDFIKMAVAMMREAIAACPADRPVPEAMLVALKRARAAVPPSAVADEAGSAGAVAHYTRDGDPARLDVLIADTRRALRPPTVPTADRVTALAQLGDWLRMRFEVRGDLEDLQESIDCLQEALDTGQDPALRALAASSLSLAHLDRFTGTQDHADLERATVLGRSALAGSNPLSETHGQVLTNLGAVLQARFHAHGDLADLGEAVRHLEYAVAATSYQQHDHAVMRIKLAVALRTRARGTGAAADLDRAVQLLRGVAELPPADGPHQQLARLELGATLTVAAQGADGLIAAAAQYRATALTPTHDVRTRLIAAHAWGLHSAVVGDLRQAGSAFRVALDDLLPKLTGRALGRSSQETQLRVAGSIACDAAAVEIRAGRPAEALVRLEQGRGVLLAQALRLRGRYAELAEASAELADRFELVCMRLVEEPGTAEERRTAAEEYDRVVADIRTLPGFTRFQMPLEWPRLRSAAAHGPVVVLNVSQLGCDAILLRPASSRTMLGALLRRPARTRTIVEVVPLAGVTEREIADRARGFLAAVAALAAAATPFADRLAHDRTVTQTLRWLGEYVTGPVLSRLGLDRPVAPGQQWPRLWWCPTGPLSLLPLHAARRPTGDGRTDDTGGYLDDLVVSSYTPTLEALLHARERSAPALQRWSAVAVGVSQAPPLAPDTLVHQPLPAVEEELAALDELPARRLRLNDTQATPQAVLAALRTHTHAHLACHGVYDPAAPSNSRLLLHGGSLTVRDLTTERLSDAEFAYLSACHTAAPGDALLDEMITLASAFQLCGYRQVIGALWTVADAIAPQLAREVYRTMATARPGTDAAHALHRAARQLRSQPHYAAPLFWASVIHIGP